MNLESQVCSLEYAKKLKEVNVKQESLFIYLEQPWIVRGNEVLETKTSIRLNDFSTFIDNSMKVYSAFTVAELGELLPDWTETIKRMNDDWVCIVRHKHNDVNDHCFADTEANARAKMLIYLLENGLIKND